MDESDFAGQHPGKKHSTVGEQGSRIWLYPMESEGMWGDLRFYFAWLLIAVYFGIPWVEFSGQPLLLFDVTDFHLVVLGASFWPQDVPIFLPAFMASIILFFAVTASLGRIWCGWACPQTIFLQYIFYPIDRLVEGKSYERSRRDRRGFCFDWAWRKVVKHALFLVFSIFLSHTMLAYFLGTERMLQVVRLDPVENWSTFVVMFLDTMFFYWVFAWFREQACVVVCPYARLQSTLIDENTLAVNYDAERGEPRTKPVHRSEGGSVGDCVGCNKCVKVCPTGIDIRDGQQLECVSCAICIDACDAVMDKYELPRGLIRHASLNQLKSKEARVVTPRFLVYCILSLVLYGVFAWLLSTRSMHQADLTRRGFSPYTMVGKDSVMNTYTIRIRNKDTKTRSYRLTLKPEGSALHNLQNYDFSLQSGELRTVPVNFTSPLEKFRRGKLDVKILVSSKQDTTTHKTRFIGPYRN